MGPVQVLVIGVDEVAFTGEVLAELSRLRSADIVRLLDVLVIARHDDGTFETVADPTAMTPAAASWRRRCSAQATATAPR